MRYHPLIIASVLAWLASPPVPGCRTYTDEELSVDLREVGEQIELLWSGTESERLAIANEPNNGLLSTAM